MCDVIEGGYPNIGDLQFWPLSQKLHPLVPQTFCLWGTANKNKVALKGEEWKKKLVSERMRSYNQTKYKTNEDDFELWLRQSYSSTVQN